MKPIVLFSIQFTLSLAAYALIALWYAVPRLSKKPRETALQPLLWVHAFRVIGGSVLAPGAVGAGVPLLFQRMIGYGDLITAALGAARAGRPARAPAGGHRVRLGRRCRRDGRHHQCDHPVDALRGLHPCAGRELGHRDGVCAGAAREQRADPVAAAQVAGRGSQCGADPAARSAGTRLGVLTREGC
jgi:hypothetical protein